MAASVIAPIAFKLFNGLLKLYDRKYGKYGEKVVAKLKRHLAKAELELQRLTEENSSLSEQCADQDVLIEQAIQSVEAWKQIAEDYLEQLKRRVAADHVEDMEELVQPGSIFGPPLASPSEKVTEIPAPAADDTEEEEGDATTPATSSRD